MTYDATAGNIELLVSHQANEQYLGDLWFMQTAGACPQQQ
jgi:hypothetical protein